MNTTDTKESLPLIPPLWRVQVAYLALFFVLVFIWVFLVPEIIWLPDQLGWLSRLYPVFLMPLYLVYLAINHLWLKPILVQSQQMAIGRLEESQMVTLVFRAGQYPYYVFMVSLIGMLVIAVTILAVLVCIVGGPLILVLELFALAVAINVVLALIAFFIARKAMKPLLQIPGVETSGFHWEPDFRRRITLGVVCTVFIAWTVMSVMVIDAQVRLETNLMLSPRWSGANQVALFLVLGGGVFVLLAGIFSSFAAKDLSIDTIAVAEGLEKLAMKKEARVETVLPVLSPDELGEFTQAFNQLVSRITKHDDILRETAELAAEANKRQMEFFSVVSHDFRTPLHSIIGFSQLLLEEGSAGLTSDQEGDLLNILKAGHHLLSLVDDVVDLSKMESGMMALARSWVAVDNTIREAVAAASGLNKRDQVHVVYDLPRNLPLVYVDETRFRQILFNLIGNAVHFTNEGEVKIRVDTRRPEVLKVSVEDSGPGVPEESQDRVFEEFEQLHSGKGGIKSEGTGLGLAITRKLVEMHGGDIWIENKPEGGAVFSFIIPTNVHEEVV